MQNKLIENKTLVLRVLIFLVIAIGLLVGVYLVKNVQETRRGATGNQMEVVFTPTPGTHDKESLEVAVGVMIPSGKMVTSYDLFLDINNLDLPLDDAALKALFEPPTEGDMVLEVKRTASGVRVIGAVFPMTDKGKVDLVKFNVNGIVPGASFSVSTKENSVSGTCASVDGLCSENLIELYTLETKTATYTRSVPATPTQSPTTCISEVEFSSVIQSGGGTRSIVSSDVGYSDVALKITTNTGVVYDNEAIVVQTAADHSWVFESEVAYSSITRIDFLFNYTGLGTGTTCGNWTKSTLPTVTPVPTSTPQPTVTAAPSDPVITFYLKFDNVARQIPDQVVQVRLIKDSNIYDFADVIVTSDANGILTGKLVASKVPVGSGYRMSIKGPKHLAMRFCEDDQSAYCFGPGNLTLNTGENNYFDFSFLPLLAGDITGQGSFGVQDGVADMTDMVLIKSALEAGSSESVINTADLNYDGGVSGADMQMFLKTLSERYDDSF